MKTLLTSTALLAGLGLAGLAGAQDQPVSPYPAGVEAGVRASDFIGKRVYLTETDTAGLSTANMADPDAAWQDAGEIGDIIISMAGDTQVVLVDFGGFLGIGEKTVAVSMNDLAMVPDADSPQDYFIVFQGTKAQLEAAPAFDPDMVFEATPAAATDDTAAAMPADGSAADPAAKPAATEEPVTLATWTEADLIGKRVYGPNDEDVGEISAVSLSADGKVQGAVVDVGGFLGIGEKRVALGDDMLTLMREADGEMWFRVNATQEQLEAMAPHAD